MEREKKTQHTGETLVLVAKWPEPLNSCGQDRPFRHGHRRNRRHSHRHIRRRCCGPPRGHSAPCPGGLGRARRRSRRHHSSLTDARRTADYRRRRRRRRPAGSYPGAPSMSGSSGSGIPLRRRSPHLHSRRCFRPRRRTAVSRWWLPHRSCCYHFRCASVREGLQPDSLMFVLFPGPVQSSL